MLKPYEKQKGFVLYQTKKKQRVFVAVSFKICRRKNHNNLGQAGQEVYVSSHVTMVQAGQDVYVSSMSRSISVKRNPGP